MTNRWTLSFIFFFTLFYTRAETTSRPPQAAPHAPQAAALVNTTASPHAVLHSVNMGDVQWTQGFWAERFAVCRDSMIPHSTRQRKIIPRSIEGTGNGSTDKANPLFRLGQPRPIGYDGVDGSS